MKTVKEKLSNGNTLVYQQLDNGTCYHYATDLNVVAQLERARETGARVRLFYGDTETGKDWKEEHDVTGTVGRSTGTIKIPLLIYSRRSMGGPAILDHCIVRLFVNQAEVYKHPGYKLPTVIIKPSSVENYSAALYLDGELYANCRTGGQADRLSAFMRGERFCK